MKIQFISLQEHSDERGSLIALEENNNIPFQIKRVYYIFNTKKGVRRGFHAHRKLSQVAIVIKGSCYFLLDDGLAQKNIILNDPSKGLLIAPMVWHEMYDFSDDCILMVLANDVYDESDYLRNYE
ncbi:WxcM-like domain-containing protein, partial [Salmonella enterica subsp. diarizonae]|nr:WxcM-like domain-containing protein [Salmonella enterica]EAW9877599.1 WxcM-like domain-containing protein [Salmonella enterica]EBA2310466.1 WxcM-like domain-containing protein [Salmonella enterica]EDF7975286.1 WxcM-like domain-containing protein [Salmonella enterica subsp. diarizonae]